MRLSLANSIVAVMLLGIATAGAQTAAQKSPPRQLGDREWCASTRVGQPECIYATLEQCTQAVAPQQGQCIKNPNLSGTTGSKQ